eukprot:TRINITY_DN1918_c0_g1_i7.p1 TRINITY_DN1918_c0_g1~~TRINITY_DN1918_c0_g1_i7.p1  ORF type:complete len:255 (-),score=44.66 TRINITY_DN1918_c0_g1_i7:211-975(-)
MSLTTIYDSDITIWSPEGRLHQMEYARVAVKKGSASVGVKSKTHVVICGLQRSTSPLSSHQQKIFSVDEYVGISISGLTADARILCKWLRTECLNYRYMYNDSYPTARLSKRLAEKAQRNTQRSGRRPYGVGLLIAGYDANGPHLLENDPSGTFLEYKAQSIGNRSQSARTYLERHMDEFASADKDELIKHALKALRATLTEKKKGDKDKEPDHLTKDNCIVGVVGEGTPFTILKETELEAYLSRLDEGKMEEQ